MSPEDELGFQDWLAEHADDPLVDDALRSVFDECLEPASDAAVADPSAKRRFMLPLIVSAAAVVCALVAVPLSYRSGREAARQDLAAEVSAAKADAEQVRSVQWLEKKVAPGHVDTLLLSDGTLMYLNAGSRITYPSAFEGAARRVFVDGEIYADVAKDASRPFFVQSGDVEVKVLGTSFDFKAYSDDDIVETSLLEGSVRLDIHSVSGDREVVMKPGNMVQFDRRSGDVKIEDFNTSLFKPFAQGRSLRFCNICMEDIARDLERTFGTKIVVMDEKLSQTRFFAIFTNGESLDEILRAMNRNHRMKITRRDGVVYLASER